MTTAPGAVWRPVVNHSKGKCSPELGLVMHVQQGYNSPQGWFNNPASQASSTFWISKTGVLEQYVDPDTQLAWAQGYTGNRTYLSCEFEGYVGEALTAAQVLTAAHLYAWGVSTRGWVLNLAEHPGEHGFGWHGMGGQAWGHPDCPGDIRKPQRADILARANALLHPPITAPTTTGDDDMTPAQEAKLDKAIAIGEQILRQFGGDWEAGNWPGWPQLGGLTVVDAIAAIKNKAQA